MLLSDADKLYGEKNILNLLINTTMKRDYLYIFTLMDGWYTIGSHLIGQ